MRPMPANYQHYADVADTVLFGLALLGLIVLVAFVIYSICKEEEREVRYK